MKRFVYKKEKTKAISFPLGGIGSGCIGLSGNGSLVDWEIFNKPNKGSINGFTHFAVKAEAEGKVIDARVLNGDFLPPYSGDFSNNVFQTSGFGFGVNRATMAGLPHFKKCEFFGEFPLAFVKFKDEKFPGFVKLTAFNPFIPANDADSSIPGAFFEIEVANSTDKPLAYTVCLSVNNPMPKGSTKNSFQSNDKIKLIEMTSDKYKKEDAEYGDITVATDADDISFQQYWYRCYSWGFDNLETFWKEFSAYGKLKNRAYEIPGNECSEDICSLAAHFEVGAKSKKSVRFIIAWNFPNCCNYWSPESTPIQKIWKNYYAKLFKDSKSSAVYSLVNWNRLYKETGQFKNTLFSSTIPAAAIEAVSANLSILKSPTCLRLEDGTFYGWEGCSANVGCCEGSCTHVWNYAYALPFLFPKLERSMRNADFKYNQREDGRMSFRLQLPLGRERLDFHACVDGQFGGVIKAYRDWKICGDSEWLKAIWNEIKNSISFAWAESNEDRWDFNRDGVIEGRQHHTLDRELFGPNAWLNGFYLAALKAGAEMAGLFDDYEIKAKYEELFKRGKKWTDERLFNGEYYYQDINLKDEAIHKAFNAPEYWNDEKNEIKFQAGEGCMADQLAAQWHANICGLGEIFDGEQTKKALQSIYKYNFKKSMRDFFNPCRIYSLNDEGGVIICEWPEGRKKPVVPIPYSGETMTGFEYQAAVHMIQEGFVSEGMDIVRAVRQRFDGEKRNPWNEFECGSNYARSMSSYALLLAFSGFEFNMSQGHIGFSPVINRDKFRCFWSLDSGWGEFIHENNTIQLSVKKGYLKLRSFYSELLREKTKISVEQDKKDIRLTLDTGKVRFEDEVCIAPDKNLYIHYIE